MVEKKDFKALREMFQDMLQENHKKNNAILRREIRDEMRKDMREMITENNEVIRRDIRDEVHSLIRASEHRVISEITEFIGSALLPQLDNHEMRLTRLEQKTV